MRDLTVIKGIVTNRTKVFETDHAAPSDIHTTGAVRKIYKITIENKTFTSSNAFGKRILSGSEYAFVLDKDEVILVRDQTGKIVGAVGFGLTLFLGALLIGFNVLMIPTYLQNPVVKNLTLLASINGVLLLIFIVSLASFIKENQAKKLLKSV